MRDVDVDTDAFARAMGTNATGEIFTTALPPVLVTNDEQHFGAVPGSLASALKRVGGVGAVGNASRIPVDRDGREVALAAIDTSGQVGTGNVSSALLAADPKAPFGLRLDPDAVVGAVQDGWAKNRVMFVELSDLERAEQARASSIPEQGDRQFASALRGSDALFARLLDTVDLRQDLVVLDRPDRTPPT